MYAQIYDLKMSMPAKTYILYVMQKIQNSTPFETWTLTKSLEQRLAAAQRNMETAINYNLCVLARSEDK